MKIKTRNNLSILLALLIIAFTAATAVFSAHAEGPSYGYCGDSLTWVLGNDGTLTISGTGDMDDYSYYKKGPWYQSMDKIENVVIENGVTSVGDNAFCNYRSLESVMIPGSVKSIGKYAFSGCEALKRVTIPSGVNEIGDNAFYDCTSLESVILPESVSSIGKNAFSGCMALKSVTIPSGVNEIGEYSFGYYHYMEWSGGTEILSYDEGTGESQVLCWDRIDEEDRKIDGFKIYCYAGTKGEEYAIGNEIDYEIIKKRIKGDVNNNGKTDATDIILIKRHILGIFVLTGDMFQSADTDGNRHINITDYIAVKRIMLGIGESGSDTEEDGETVYISTYVIYDPEGIKLENVCFKGKEAASLHEMLGKLSYSKDLICDCSPRYLLTFSNGDKYYIKYDYGFDDKIDGICKYTGSINEVQAMADESIKPYLDLLLEYAYNSKEPGIPVLHTTLPYEAGTVCSAETTATHIGYYPVTTATQIYDPSATDPEPTYISASCPSESDTDTFYFYKEYSSSGEIPEDLKKILRYTVKINDGSYILNAVQVVINDEIFSRYFFRHESEADNYVWGKNGYDVEFHCNTDYTVERYAADYGKAVEADGTYFEAIGGVLYVPLENGYCRIRYPEGNRVCDKSVFTIYEFE